MQGLAFVMEKEQDINQFIDQELYKIDRDISAIAKGLKIKQIAAKNDVIIQQFRNYFTTKFGNGILNTFNKQQASTVAFNPRLEVFELQFVKPWNNFKAIFETGIANHPQYIKLCRRDNFRDYYEQLMTKNRRDLNFIKDKQIAITFDDVSKDMVQLYSQFYENVVAIIKAIQNIAPYQVQITAHAKRTVNTVENAIPNQAKSQFKKVRSQWEQLFITIFKYKMKTAFLQFGEIPSVINLLQDEQVLMQAFRQTEDVEKSQNQSIADEIEFMRVFIESAKEDPVYQNEEQFRQFDQVLTGIQSQVTLPQTQSEPKPELK